MKIAFAPHTTDVKHIIVPYLKKMLKQFDYVVVSPYMGVEQFKEFGERIVVDCRVPLGMNAKRAVDGKPMDEIYEDDALAAGLSILKEE